MASNTNNRSIFTQLFRRRVLQILAIYGAGCWTVVQIVEWIIGRYLISPHLTDLCLIGMLSFIPSIALIAYFHGTPGRDKWHPIEKIGIPINVTETVSCEDELGNRIDKVVPKNVFRKKIAIFYFENETGDSTLDWLRYGLPWLCNSDLEQDFYISHITQDYFDYKIENAGYTRDDNLPLSLKKKIAKTLNKNYFFEGSFNAIDDTYIIKTKLYETKNGNIITENRLLDANIFSLIDKLTRQLKIDLEIPLQYLNTTTDLPVQSITTDNVQAFKSYIEGGGKWADDKEDAAFEYYNNSITYDKYFLQAQVDLSWLKMNHFQDASWKEHWDIILKSIDKLTDRAKFDYKMTYYGITGDEVLYKKLALRQIKLYPHDIEAHNNLAGVYYSENNPKRFENSMREYKIILQLDPERYEYYQKIGNLYKKMAQYDSSIYYYTKYTKAVPDDIYSYYQLAVNYANKGKFLDAINAMQTAMMLGYEEIWMKSQMLWYKKSLNMDTSIDIINDLNNMLTISSDFEDSVHIYYQLSWAHHLFGQNKVAVKYSNLIKSLKERKYGLYRAIFPIVNYDVELYILAGLKEKYKEYLIYIENNAVSPDENIIPYFYSKYYLFTENFDMLAATIDDAEEGYGNY